MEYLGFNPDLTFKRYEKQRDYHYDFLKIIDNNFPVLNIYHYLNSMIEFKLKNVWNTIIIHWIQMNNKMNKRNKTKYLESIYPTQQYYHIHTIMDSEKLNDLLVYFVNDDPFKALFAVICIQNTFHI